jgi:hypothetical protein
VALYQLDILAALTQTGIQQTAAGWHGNCAGPGGNQPGDNAPERKPDSDPASFFLVFSPLN